MPSSDQTLSTRSHRATRRRNPCIVHTPDIFDLTVAIAEHVLHLHYTRLFRRPKRDSSMRGEKKVEEWLRRHPAAMHDHLSVSPTTFGLILGDLETLGDLKPTLHTSSRVQLAIFLYTCRDGGSVRHAGECFQKSNETIAR